MSWTLITRQLVKKRSLVFYKQQKKELKGVELWFGFVCPKKNAEDINRNWGVKNVVPILVLKYFFYFYFKILLKKLYRLINNNKNHSKNNEWKLKNLNEKLFLCFLLNYYVYIRYGLLWINP